MSAGVVKSQFDREYKGIKDVVNDANRQIRNYNLKIIAKIAALFAIFTLGGIFAYLACIKLGASAMLAGATTIPFFIGMTKGYSEIIARNQNKQFSLIKKISEEVKKNLALSWRLTNAINLESPFGPFDPFVHGGKFTITEVSLDSYDQIKQRYEKQSQFLINLPKFIGVLIPFGVGFVIGCSRRF